ncbi:MAG: hypothetical protein ABI539_07570 [Acidobacteriota bacterium]
MKSLRQLLFTLFMVAGLAMAVSAQKDDQKKPPPKEGRPPVVTPADKNKPKDPPPKGNDRPKKPETSWTFAYAKTESDRA